MYDNLLEISSSLILSARMTVMSDKVKIIYTGKFDDAFKQHVVDRLHEVSYDIIKTDSPVSTSCSIPALLFIREYSQDILENVLHLSRDHYLLIVTCGKTTLPYEQIIRLLDAGGKDVLSWNTERDIMDDVISRLRQWQDLCAVRQSDFIKKKVVGKSYRWRTLLEKIIEVAYFTNDSILLIGETGTGKELIAKLIHEIDQRKNKGRYYILDCAAVVPELSGSEFFGHERGAFTGAITSRDGAFSLADGGTLFLDEVGELPANLQAQLLRVIQEGSYRRVGSNRWYHTHFRLICATNKNLLESVDTGQFRRDLYYRIAHWVFELPPLRDRKEDIIPLANYFLQQEKKNGPMPVFDSHVERFLLLRDYPGNIRELRSLVSRISHLNNQNKIITLGCLPKDEIDVYGGSLEPGFEFDFEEAVRQCISSGFGLDMLLENTMRFAVRAAIESEINGTKYTPENRAMILRRAAERLGRTKRSLEDYDKKYSILERFKSSD